MPNAAQQAFLNAMQEKVRQSLAGKINGRFDAVLYPSGFNYGITYGGNAYYNAKTLADIDTLLAKGSEGGLELIGGQFSTLYYQVLGNVRFVVSTADQKRSNDEAQAAQSQIRSVIVDYEDSFGPCPSDAGPSKIAYIMGTLRKNYGPDIVDALPPEYNALRRSVAAYLDAAAFSAALDTRQVEANNRLKAARANTKNPTGKNGGMQVDASNFMVGYQKIPTGNQFLGALKTVSNSVSVDVRMSNFKNGNANITVNNGSGVSVDLPLLVDFSRGGSSHEDLSSYTTESSIVTMSLTHPGIFIFDAYPSELEATNSSGWYDNVLLHEVREKTGKDVTGFQLVGSEYSVDELFGQGGRFARLKTFVISQEPTISMIMTNVNTQKVAHNFQKSSSVGVKVLGLFSVGGESSYAVTSVEADEKSSTVRLSMGPPAPSGTTPLQDQVAFVLGGVASYPPDSI